MKWLALTLLLIAGVAQAGGPFRILRPSETVAVGSTQSNSVILGANQRWARVVCSVTCWVGSAATNTAAASAASNAILLLPDTVETIGVSSGGYLLTLRDSINGKLFMTVIEPQ